MELKRTARDITGNCRDFPGQKNVRIGIQAAAGYAFAMGILEKYRQAEGYDRRLLLLYIRTPRRRGGG